MTIDGDHNLARLWSAMICLPHVRPLQEEKTVHKKLSSLIQKLTTGSEKQDKHTRGSAYLLSQVKINENFQRTFVNIFLPIILGAQKNRLIETVLLSTHNICVPTRYVLV